MPLIRRTWSAKDADEWTKEDLIACVVSVLVYILYTIGVALSCLLIPMGFILTGLAILGTLLLVWVINPKLSVVSTEYEKKQHEYLEDLEKKVKWQE